MSSKIRVSLFCGCWTHLTDSPGYLWNYCDFHKKEVTNDESGSRPERLSRPALFMGIAKLFGQRSTCPRADVGAVAVIEGRIVATGYVGAPAGQPHCDEVGCQLEAGHCVRTIHAEANLVAWAARVGTSLRGSKVYTTHSPCRKCAQLLANAGVKQLAYDEVYNRADLKYLQDLGVEIAHWQMVEMSFEY